jgi:hypothetical protein
MCKELQHQTYAAAGLSALLVNPMGLHLKLSNACVAACCFLLLLGVVWFGRLCGAMGCSPPDAFRAWLAVLGPELLKGPFNHEERQQVRRLASGHAFAMFCCCAVCLQACAHCGGQLASLLACLLLNLCIAC